MPGALANTLYHTWIVLTLVGQADLFVVGHCCYVPPSSTDIDGKGEMSLTLDILRLHESMPSMYRRP